MRIVRNTCFGALASLAAMTTANLPSAAQQQPGQISAARRAAIERCVQQAHQEVPDAQPDTNAGQRRYLVYVNCMTAAGLEP